MAASIVDPVFGHLRATEEQWVGKVAVGSLGDAVRVAIDSRHGWKQVRKPPTESQQRAFANFVRQGDALMPRVVGELIAHYDLMWPQIETDPFRPRSFTKMPKPGEKTKIVPLFGSPRIEIPIQEEVHEGREEESVILIFNDPFWDSPLEVWITNCSEIEVDSDHGG